MPSIRSLCETLWKWNCRNFRIIEAIGLVLVLGAAGLELKSLRSIDRIRGEFLSSFQPILAGEGLYAETDAIRLAVYRLTSSKTSHPGQSQGLATTSAEDLRVAVGVLSLRVDAQARRLNRSKRVVAAIERFRQRMELERSTTVSALREKITSGETYLLSLQRQLAADPASSALGEINQALAKFEGDVADGLFSQLPLSARYALDEIEAQHAGLSKVYKILLILGSALLVAGKFLNWRHDVR